MLNFCVLGASGRMGREIINEVLSKGFSVTGAIVASDDSHLGLTLSDAGIAPSATTLFPPEQLIEVARGADVCISFTTPTAELVNLPKLASLNIPLIVGTTGFSSNEWQTLHTSLTDRKVRAVFSANFSLGVNILFKLSRSLQAFPTTYDVSITEIHHRGKKDAPSGTAKRLSEIISQERGYSQLVYGREGTTERLPNDLEVYSLRLGGVPGIHSIHVAGEHELFRLEHTAFSRKVFAQGALCAAEWIIHHPTPGIYSMEDVLSIGGS